MIVSVDPDEEGLRKNGSRLRIVADGARLPFKESRFQLVMAENVFEHLAAPEAVLRECARCLSSDGWLVFLCPNRLGYIAVVGSVTPHAFHVWWRRRMSATAEDDTFVTYYRLNSSRRIRRVAGRAGLRVESLRSLVGWPTYWEFSDVLHRIMCVMHRLLEAGPALCHLTLVGVLRKRP